jgi:hypothetical protein
MARSNKYTHEGRFKEKAFHVSRAAEYHRIEHSPVTKDSMKSYRHKPYTNDYRRDDDE